MDTFMDYIIDPIAGNPSRNRMFSGNVCMHVDDLTFTGTDDFLSFARELKKSFQMGWLDENWHSFMHQLIWRLTCSTPTLMVGVPRVV